MVAYRFVIRGGTLVDGTGAPARKADIRVAAGRITEIGEELAAEARERVIDASNCYVAPGFIETHNHYDAPIWWQPTLDPLPGYGVTTSINGNCGFSPAPISDNAEARLEMVKIFSFFEDIPVVPFNEILPWDWRLWSQYRDSMRRHLKFPANYAAFVGHIAIRLAVMGLEAWDRAARPEEIAAMCGLLEDALQAGALGLSSNLLDHDGQDRPVPSLKANDAEFTALLDVLAKFPEASLQIIVDSFQRMTAVASLERMGALCGPRGIRMQWTGVPNSAYQSSLRKPLFDLQAKFKDKGYNFWMGFSHVPPSVAVSFLSTLAFAQSNNYVWHEVITAPAESAKMALLEDAAWRERARASWEKTHPHSPLGKSGEITLSESESGFGPVGLTLAEYAAGRDNAHPSDALADWLIDNGFRSTITLKMSPRDRALCIELFRDQKAVGNISDSGAHGQMLCGIGDHIDLLADYVRDSGNLTIEEGIHNLSGKQAELFGLTDRGEIKVGKRADIVVFDLNAVERRPIERVYDVPDGEGARTWRYSRAPAPMLLTLVNGIPTFDQGRFTGLYPGEFLSPHPEPLAEAAE